MAPTPLEQARKRIGAMKLERQSTWDAHYLELAEYINPWKSRFMTSDRNNGRKRGTKIINGHGRKCVRILASGMMAGLTNPSRPWFALETFDPDLMEYAPVKEWLEKVEVRMNMVLSRSNFYNEMPKVYAELGTFGTGCFSLMDDYDDVTNMQTFTVGEYMIAQDDKRRVNAFGREFEITVENVVQWFGYKNCSPAVQRDYDKGNYDTWVKVNHLIERDHKQDIWLGMGGGRPFRQLYWEDRVADKNSNSDKQFLQAVGMHEFAVMAPRWETNTGDIYGNGPGQDALADIKQLQTMEKRKLNKLEKHTNPAMRGSALLKTERTSSLPGDMTYEPDGTQNRYEPAYQIDGDIRDIAAEIQNKKTEIGEFFFTDLFLALINDQRNQRATAREIAEIHEEKLLMLGPVLGQINREGLDPAIARLFGQMNRARLIPPPPPEMNGMPISVKYTSILAQAQRMVDVGAIERTATFVTTLAGAFPQALDRFDVDNAIDKYQEITGAPVSLIIPLARAQETRQARAQAEQQQALAAQGAQAIDSAKQLSETQTNGTNALSDILGL